MIPPKPGIYKITIGRRYYYGSTKNFFVREKQHREQLKLGKHCNQILQACYNKHGASAYKFRIVERVENVKDLLPREQVWLDKYFGRTFCANIVKKAGSPPTGPMAAATKKKISDTHKRTGFKPGKLAHQKCREAKTKPVWIQFDGVRAAACMLGMGRRRLENYLRGLRKWPAGLTGRYA